MRDKLHILVIDDDATSRNIICRYISDLYDVSTADNGEEGIRKALEIRPDIILLDVEMPGLNGYEASDQLKQLKETSQIPVMFLSSRSSLRERMLGYESGAVDYLTKPCDKDELLAKINVLKEYMRLSTRLKTEVESASTTAMTAIQGSSEMGLVVQFVERLVLVNTVEDLAREMFATLSQLELNCCIYFNAENSKRFLAAKGEVKPLEKELLIMIADGERFHDFGTRTVINYPHITLLVKNMPLDNRERYGRIKDLLPAFLAASDSKLVVVDAYVALQDQSDKLNQSMLILKDTLSNIAISIQENQRKGSDTVRHMFDSLERRIPSMGLDDDQEGFIVDTIDSAVQEILKLQDTGTEITNSFSTVMKLMQHLSSKQSSLIDTIFRAVDKTAASAMGESDHSADGDGVDLF